MLETHLLAELHEPNLDILDQETSTHANPKKYIWQFKQNNLLADLYFGRFYLFLKNESEFSWCCLDHLGAPVAEPVKRWPTDLVDQVRSPVEVKSSQL